MSGFLEDIINSESRYPPGLKELTFESIGFGFQFGWKGNSSSACGSGPDVDELDHFVLWNGELIVELLFRCLE